MKIYERIVVDIKSGAVLESSPIEYVGPVAMCFGGGSKAKQPKAEMSAAGQIILGKVRDPLEQTLLQGLTGADVDAYTQRAIDQGVRTARGGYGARGLAGSGIAQRAEQELIQDTALKGALQKMNFAQGVLGTGGSSPSIANPAQQQPRGFLGLK